MDDGMMWGNEGYDIMKKWMEDLTYMEIPVSAARKLAQAHEKDQVIIICWDKCYRTSHVTTYGKSFTDSHQAAIGGNKIKKMLHWPDEHCHAEPYRVRTVKEALKRFKKIIRHSPCLCTETHFCDIHGDLVLADQAIKAMQ